MDRMIGRSSCILGWIGRWPVCCFSFPIRVRPVPGDHAAMRCVPLRQCSSVFRTLPSAEVQWVDSVREVTRIFNEHGIRVSHSKVYHIQAQRDDHDVGRPNTRAMRPLPKQAQFRAVGVRGERYL